MAHPREQLLSGAPVINQLAALRHFAHGCLEGDPIQPQALHPSLPPVGLCLQYLRQLCLRDAITLASLDEHLAAYTAVIQNRGDALRQPPTAGECAMCNRDNGHQPPPPSSRCIALLDPIVKGEM